MSRLKRDFSSLSDSELDEYLKHILHPYSGVDCSLQSRIKEIGDEKERRVRSKSEKESSFLGSIVVAFKEKTHTDIQLRPGKNNGPCIPAHRVVLASRSKILKQMLECDPTPSHTLTFPEMNREELESLLEFLYAGNLGKDKMEKHMYVQARQSWTLRSSL